METYVEKWQKRNTSLTSHSYDEYGSKYQFVIYEEWIEPDICGDITVKSEKELKFLLKQCTNIYDEHEDPAYTKDEIREEIEKYRQRKRNYIKKISNNKKRMMSLSSSIADLIEK